MQRVDIRTASGASRRTARSSSSCVVTASRSHRSDSDAAPAAAAESAALQQGLTPTSVDECWFNMLRPGGWNCLHTHAGSTYSAAFFVADGACSDAADPLAGRLAFLPGGPTQAGTADLHARSAPSLQLLCSSPDAPAPHPN